MAGEIYFDNNATTRVLPEVAEAMLPFLTEQYGNPSSIHRFGSQVGQKLADARERVTELIGAADPVEVIFTSWAPKETTRRSAACSKRARTSVTL